MPVRQSASERRRLHRRGEDLRLLQRDKELEAAQRTCQALFQHHRVEELVEQVLWTALEGVNAEAGSILLADYENHRLVFQYVVGQKSERLQGTSFPWHQGIAGSVFQSGEAAVIQDVKQDPRHFGDVDLLTGFTTRDMITVPLKKWQGAPIGVLNVLNKRDGVLDLNDLAHLMIIAAVAAVAIQQARLFEEAKLAEVGRLLGDIGHDLKNLLQPLVMGLEILKDEMTDIVESAPSEKVKRSEALCREEFKLVEDTCFRIQDRVKQIADCVKGLTSAPKFSPCRISAVVEAVLRTLRVVADEKDLVLRAEGLDALPSIQADECRLFNAFYNLVSNAIAEVPAGGRITIQAQAELDKRCIRVAVIDTGQGMPPDVLQSLFSSRAISRKPGGTGLGTKIVKDVVDAHRGEITVESHVGRGTVFSLKLPRDPGAPSATSPRMGG